MSKTAPSDALDLVPVSLVWEDYPGGHMVVFVDEPSAGTLIRGACGRPPKCLIREALEHFSRMLAEALRSTTDPGAAP